MKIVSRLRTGKLFNTIPSEICKLNPTRFEKHFKKLKHNPNYKLQPNKDTAPSHPINNTTALQPASINVTAPAFLTSSTPLPLQQQSSTIYNQ